MTPLWFLVWLIPGDHVVLNFFELLLDN